MDVAGRVLKGVDRDKADESSQVAGMLFCWVNVNRQFAKHQVDPTAPEALAPSRAAAARIRPSPSLRMAVVGMAVWWLKRPPGSWCSV